MMTTKPIVESPSRVLAGCLHNVLASRGLVCVLVAFIAAGLGGLSAQTSATMHPDFRPQGGETSAEMAPDETGEDDDW